MEYILYNTSVILGKAEQSKWRTELSVAETSISEQ